MCLQVKDLRNLGDEVAKEVGVRGGDMSLVPDERRGFEELMKLVSRMSLAYLHCVCMCVCVCACVCVCVCV